MKNPVYQVVIEQRMDWRSHGLFDLWWRRHTTRRQLRLIMEQDPARLYDDLGLTDTALRLECRKWFWEP